MIDNICIVTYRVTFRGGSRKLGENKPRGCLTRFERKRSVVEDDTWLITGLRCKKLGFLRVDNAICIGTVFTRDAVLQGLTSLRPFTLSFNRWSNGVCLFGSKRRFLIEARLGRVKGRPRVVKQPVIAACFTFNCECYFTWFDFSMFVV